MDVRIVGTDLPPRSWGDPRPGGCIYRNVHVGLQRRAEVVELFPSDGAEAVWDLTIDVRAGPEGADFGGPYVHGKRGDRFLYLSWGAVGDTGAFEMFRRAKLMLAAVDEDIVPAASQPGYRLVGRLGLTGGDAGPRCAAVRPPAIDWTVEAVHVVAGGP